MDAYYTEQLITYMGNKRKIIPHIEGLLNTVKTELGQDKLVLGDGFSGSGIVSRLFKNHASRLYVNDLAGYSKTLNDCYLANPDAMMVGCIEKHIVLANTKVLDSDASEEKFIQKHWAPLSDDVKKGERAYYTAENGRRIDRYRAYINTLVPNLRCFLLGPLLVESSKHNNCSGNFAAYYKKDDVGHFGGEKELDLGRITANIELPIPIFSKSACDVVVSQKDTNLWIKELDKELDLVYYDPPYNKHPYHIYYFLLDIINNWDTSVEIPDTFRGQPAWTGSAYNSLPKAAAAFEDLIKNTRAKFILISYNNEGIIGEEEMRGILGKYGKVKEHYLEHNVYNRMKGIAEYKKGAGKKSEKIKECLYLVDRR